MSYETRINACTNALTQTLLRIMVEKRTNLCVAVDVTSGKELVELLPKIGPHICILKRSCPQLLINKELKP